MPEEKKKEENEEQIIATAIFPNGRKNSITLSATTPSASIVQSATDVAQVTLQPVEYEMFIETIERSRGLVDSGYEISLTLPEALGGGSFTFKKQPTKEIKTIKKAKYKTDK